MAMPPMKFHWEEYDARTYFKRHEKDKVKAAIKSYITEHYSTGQRIQIACDVYRNYHMMRVTLKAVATVDVDFMMYELDGDIHFNVRLHKSGTPDAGEALILA